MILPGQIGGFMIAEVRKKQLQWPHQQRMQRGFRGFFGWVVHNTNFQKRSGDLMGEQSRPAKYSMAISENSRSASGTYHDVSKDLPFSANPRDQGHLASLLAQSVQV